MKEEGGVVMGMFNTRTSIEGFARACLQMAVDLGMPLYMSTKDTILKEYDGMFRDVFRNIYEQEF